MEKEIKLKTQWPSSSTVIRFGNDYALKTRLPEILEERKGKVAILTDKTVEELYRSEIEHLDLKIFSFPAGEFSKTRETKQILEDHLLSHQFGRDSLVIGLGGGVVNDLVGFVASTYCRGISLIQIPTTLLGMVDASVGGKTGVNTPYGKNLIGSFYPANEVLIDGCFLSSLPEKQKKTGVVEMIKSGLIDSPSLFRSLQGGFDLWQTGDLDFLMDRIYETVIIKKDIVELDPDEEKGLRRILNFGHTFGHALEQVENYEIEHGEAVAIGILVSCYISIKMGLLDADVMNEVQDIFKQYQIPLRFFKQHPLDEFMGALARDKKSINGNPRFVLLQRMGQACLFEGEYCSHVEFSFLEDAITWMHNQFYRPYD